MTTGISRTQKICMSAFATLFGAVDVGCAVLAIRNNFGRGGFDNPYDVYLTGGAFFTCTFVAATVAGIWLGGAVSRMWRSTSGRLVFVTSGCGVLGGVLATFGALHWIVHDGYISSTEFRADTMIAGVIILGGTLAGLIGGYLFVTASR